VHYELCTSKVKTAFVSGGRIVKLAARPTDCTASVAVGIRHPEELSLARQLDSDELKRNQGVSAVRRTQIPGMMASSNGHAPANNSYDSGTGTLSSPYRTSTLSPQVTLRR